MQKFVGGTDQNGRLILKCPSIVTFHPLFSMKFLATATFRGSLGFTMTLSKAVSYTHLDVYKRQFYVYISKSKNGWQYLDSLGGAAYTSAKEEYVEHPFLVMQTAMHHAEANSRNEVEYE